MVNGKTLMDLSIEEIDRNFRTNLISHFYTLKTFLPAMVRLRYGTIVTISSVLGATGAASVSDYAAAKAGLSAMHKSLSAELRAYPGIKTVLVAPGQIQTRLFEGVKTSHGFLAPVLEPVDVAKEIIRAIDEGQSMELAMPLYARWIEWLNVLPVGIQRGLRWAAGIDKAMETFKGQLSS
jgi:NAD(P)-dependent dehydrogenase (short-subunit alcohol dehydrogenase family)